MTIENSKDVVNNVINKIMRFILSLIPVLTATICFSQVSIGTYHNSKKPYIIELNRAQEETFHEFPFKIIDVVDSTLKRGKYGTVRKGHNQSYRYVEFENSIESEFHQYINRASFFNPLGKEITMVIKNFTLQQERQKIIIILGINYLHEGSLYKYDLQTYRDDKPADIKKYPARIAELINESLRQLERIVIEE